MKSCRIISASLDGGKSTYIKKLIDADKRAKGFFSIKGDSSYSLMNIQTGESRLLLSLEGNEELRFGRWYVYKEVFAWANEILSNIDNGNVYIDEVGRMELEGLGFDYAINSLKHKKISLTLAVRDIFVLSVIDRYKLENVEVIQVP